MWGATTEVRALMGGRALFCPEQLQELLRWLMLPLLIALGRGKRISY